MQLIDGGDEGERVVSVTIDGIVRVFSISAFLRSIDLLDCANVMYRTERDDFTVQVVRTWCWRSGVEREAAQCWSGTQ